MDYSAVEIGAENISALRSFLLEGPPAWEPLRSEMHSDEVAAGYMSLLYGAFCVAVRRRFTPFYTDGEIIRFVADLRITAGPDARLINTLAAEDMIRRVVGTPPLEDSVLDDVETVLYAEVFILLYLVGEANFDDADLDDFIQDATVCAKEWLAARHAESSTWA
ncbi:hypothetical protein [Actinomadura chibensis]|uniref:Uncharacterized protein n=1 Tax=Actinomadura chibensis TaxID=392828 RepID=A0A5D0NED7_9ACTN|nr:hypothetical protein [Actinomadura chibensis]TYB42683.1 hypothetical protein FXF69_28235 [Actinomadura chibensis]